MKRSFIPPENRPEIRGSQLRAGIESRHYLAIFQNTRRRRQFIHALLDGEQQIPDLDARAVSKLLRSIFRSHACDRAPSSEE